MNEFMWWPLMSTPSPHSSNNLTGFPPPRPLAQRLGAILWPAFLMAGVGCMVLFGLYDPLDLAQLLDPDFMISRPAGYALGFFCLWVMTSFSSMLTWFLLRPKARFSSPQA